MGAVDRIVPPMYRAPARFLRALDKAAELGLPEMAEDLAKIADRAGEEVLGLVARYRMQGIVPKDPPKGPPAKLSVAPVSGLVPQRGKDTGAFLHDLFEGRTPFSGKRALKELAEQTEPNTHGHRLASELAKLSDDLPNCDLLALARDSYGSRPKPFEHGSLPGAMAQVANKVVETFQVKTSAQGRSLVMHLLEQPGLSESSRLHLVAAIEAAAALEPERKARTAFWSMGLGPWGKPNREAEKQSTKIFLEAIARVGAIEVPAPEATAPVAIASVAKASPPDPTPLVKRLAELKSASGEWRVFRTDYWNYYLKGNTPVGQLANELSPTPTSSIYLGDSYLAVGRDNQPHNFYAGGAGTWFDQAVVEARREASAPGPRSWKRSLGTGGPAESLD